MAKGVNSRMEELKTFLLRKMGSAILAVTHPAKNRFLIDLKPDGLKEAIKVLMDKYESPRFITITAIDKGLDMEFLHHFDVRGIVLTIRTLCPKEENVLDSVADIVPASAYVEREISDLFGVKLRGHQPDKRLLLPEDWPEDQSPLRGPLTGELPQQTRPVVDSLITTGCVASVSSFMQRRREGAGLPPSPPLVFSDDKALREYHALIEATELDKKAGYSWEKRKLRY